jgi:hypothetical protein
MAIRFETERGPLTWVEIDGEGRWQGPLSLLRAIAAWPVEDRSVTPLGPVVEVDPVDEAWQYLQVMTLLDYLGVDYLITARPPLPEIAPPGTIV